MESRLIGHCLLCGAGTTPVYDSVFDTRFGIPEPFQILHCPVCRGEQIEPMPESARLVRWYEDYYNFGGGKESFYTQLREKLYNSFLYKLWLTVDGDISFHLRKGRGKLLDVGCNEGRSLSLFKKHGFEPEGLELNKHAAEKAAARGFNVYTVSFDQFKSSDIYNFVVLSNVLEHSLTPFDMLTSIQRLLASRGQIWISCPNAQSWLKSLFGRSWINWHVPFHIVQFSENSLRQLLEKAGFTNIKIQMETPSIWVAQSLIAFLFAKPHHPTKQLRSSVLVMGLLLIIRGLLFPMLWLGNLLGRGDCLVVTAEKK